MDLSSIPALLKSHAYVPLAALLVGFVVWLLKTRPALEDKIPPRVRPWVAVGLGQIAAVLQAVSLGTPWKDAILNGLLASLTAMFGHDVGVEVIRGGKEVGSGSDDGTPKPPKPPLAIISGAVLALFVSLSGCGLFGGSGASSPTLDLKDPAAMRAVLASGAEGVLDAWNICKTTARSLGAVGAAEHNAHTVQAAIDLSKQCESEYEHAREALMLGQSVLDIYENAYEGRVACAALTGFDGLKHLEALVSQFSKAALPKSVTDAEQNLQRLVAALVAPLCPLPMPATTADAGSDVPILTAPSASFTFPVDAAVEGG